MSPSMLCAVHIRAPRLFNQKKGHLDQPRVAGWLSEIWAASPENLFSIRMTELYKQAFMALIQPEFWANDCVHQPARCSLDPWSVFLIQEFQNLSQYCKIPPLVICPLLLRLSVCLVSWTKPSFIQICFLCSCYVLFQSLFNHYSIIVRIGLCWISMGGMKTSHHWSWP